MEKALNPQDLIAMLQACIKNGCTCQGCPYNDPDYENDCGKLLADAAQLLALAYPAEVSD